MTLWSQFTYRSGKFGVHSLAIVFALIATATLLLLGIVPAIEQSNRDVRSSLFEREASGQFAVVEMDSQSLKAIGNWPWPRDVHANIIKKLSDNGAGQIAFDVDFSSQSNTKSDQHLANNINNADAQVILATFRQKVSNQSAEYTENLPLADLRANAMLASVNVHPDDLGQVSYYDYGTNIYDAPRPTLAAMLTSSAGQIEQSFLIDQSVEFASIPKFSAIDILNGDFQKSQIEGRSFIIGATAVELGDRYATPNNGIIPGVFIHALAAETLAAERDLSVFDGSILLFVAIILAMLCWNIMRQSKTGQNRLVLPLFGALLVVSSWGFFAYSIVEIEIALSLVFITCLFLADWIIEMIRTMQRERNSDLQTRLPNGVAMMHAASKKSDARIAVAEIANFAELEVMMSAEEQSVAIRSMAKRLALLADGEKVYRTSKDQLSWFIGKAYHQRLDEHFETAAAFALAPVDAGSRPNRLRIHLGYNAGPTDNWFQLFGDASIAAHKATQLGYRWLEYSNDIYEVIGEKLAILNDIDDAISEGQIWVAYQPKFDIAENVVNAAEALVRWEHPERGMIGPDRFIPILEDEGRIADLTLHVLKTTLIDVAKWQAAGLTINCSINVSAILLDDAKFVASALALVQNHPVNVEQISFEITETAALSDLNRAKAVLQGIREIGVKLSIDDYGTGQSNLSYLQGFPADEIKIDQSFIKSMVTNDVDRVMVSSTIEMAHKMNFKVVAEGVEDLECLTLLQKFDCDVAQGWHIGKPINSEMFEQQWNTKDIAKSA